VLDRSDNGLVIRERTEESGCAIGMGMERSIAISLWSPIDALAVAFVSVD